MIEIKSLHQNYGNLVVLDNLDLSIQRGEVVAIIGPSGCGKTTLLRCITGLESNYTGEIILDNRGSKEYLKRNRIAVVLQKYSNFHWLTVYDNVATAFLTDQNISLDDQEKKINSLLSDLRIADFRNSYMNELSGGMQQRVAIARALAQDTAILALDEPFGALDIRNRHTLQLLFKELNSKFKRTVLLITHDIEEALFLSDRILIQGRIPSHIIQEFSGGFKEEHLQQVKYSKDFVGLKKAIEEKMFMI